VKQVRSAGLLLLALTVMSGCTVHQDEIPALTGPSEFALSIEVTATPDHIRQDGASQSTVVVRARGTNGQPVGALPIRLDMSVHGVMQDFGTLSERNIVTGSDGLARSLYTAPAAPPLGTGGSGTTMFIFATPYGTNSQTSVSQSVSIDLVPPGIILPPAGAPVASFTVSPTPLNAAVPALFDGSASQPGTNSTQLVSYSWSFGDGSTASGSSVTHAFRSSGTFTVTLTVTNDRGLSASTTQAVSVSAGTPPTAAFVFSPSQPAPLTEVQFNGQLSTPGTGRTITQYLWNWGDGDTGTGSLQDHDYLVEGNYTVVLTVVDDLGQRGTATQSVPVKVAPATP
jgi:PKD repeat protein